MENQVISVNLPADIVKKLQQTAAEEYLQTTLGAVASAIIKEHYERKDSNHVS